MRQPPPPGKRRQPLPEQQPNPSSDDPEALAKIKAIAESQTYRRADRDPDFLQRADMRGVRLMLDYLKPQTLLNEHDVAHTIVVFGSTRIPEPAVASRAAAELPSALPPIPRVPNSSGGSISPGASRRRAGITMSRANSAGSSGCAATRRSAAASW